MIRIGSIVLRVDDLQRQTEFWEPALGYVRRDSGESDDFVLLGPPDGAGPHLSVDQVRSTLQIPPRLHLDLYTNDQAGEVERFLAVGATEVHWGRRSAGSRPQCADQRGGSGSSPNYGVPVFWFCSSAVLPPVSGSGPGDCPSTSYLSEV